MDIFKMYEKLGIEEDVYAFCEDIWQGLAQRFKKIDETAEYNQLKVIEAMHKSHIGEANLIGTTGYGYDDIGRDSLEEVYARVFDTEDALVRPQITCGTHAISLALFSNLRPGDELLSISGKPYDTLESVIGIRDAKGSFKEYGISYAEVALKDDGGFDFEGIKKAINKKTRVAAIQRSKGYAVRPTLSVEQIGEAVDFIKEINPGIKIFVDNCYGEFTERIEPGSVGADMTAGSLIKNPGGGLAAVGGYIAGTKECVENAAYRLTSPGLGKEVGASLGILPSFYQGLFLSPFVTASAMKGAIFAAKLYERLGFEVYPSADSTRYDIIQAVTMGSKEALISFCAGIQSASPVDSFVSPEPSYMPGYEHEVIMAAGNFVSGSSIELSADGPLKAPFTVYFQGGLTPAHAKYGIMNTVQKLVSDKIIDRKLLK
ncbi:MAG: methionine gamma-lyase family protein [Lachnospiraceae bacterium]|nr:methionine gamma-lyase family protein [Lachnospiraceae bacterium]